MAKIKKYTGNPIVVEWIYPNDKRVKPQTVAHHMARYRFTATYRKPENRNLALDLACGTGYGVDILRQTGYKAEGIDISHEAISFAKSNYPLCKFRQLDITFWQPQPNQYSLITLFEAIEHLSFAKGLKLLTKVRTSLKKGGLFMISTPKDINAKYNFLHKSQWDYATLKNNLGSLFSPVTMYGQDWDTGLITQNQPMDDDFFFVICQK